MARLASREHLARGDVQGGEQVKRAVANVIVRPSFGLPDVHRQDRLRTLERLDLGFLVEREYGGIRRRIHIEPHDVAHFLDPFPFSVIFFASGKGVKHTVANNSNVNSRTAIRLNIL
jgi:hypothetical protein